MTGGIIVNQQQDSIIFQIHQQRRNNVNQFKIDLFFELSMMETFIQI
jgi:hypothetical protein